MSWYDVITTQFSGRIPGGTGADDIEHPLRVGAPIPGIATDLLLASPLSTLLQKISSYKPSLHEEPTLKALESHLFSGQMIPIAGWLFDYQVVQSYRASWLEPSDCFGPDYSSNIPSGMALTFLEVEMLRHTHSVAATTELGLLHEELRNLHIPADDDVMVPVHITGIHGPVIQTAGIYRAVLGLCVIAVLID